MTEFEKQNRKEKRKRIYHERKIKGLCVYCGQENDTNFITCSECAKIKRKQEQKFKNSKKGKQYLGEYRKGYNKSEKRRNYMTNYMKQRSEKDPNFLLARKLRIRFYRAIKGNFKTGSAISNLGCDIFTARAHIESQFQPEMSWDNYGKDWHIDHVRPLISFDLTNENQLKEACNYKNLQPLWIEDRNKKSVVDRAGGGSN